MDRIRQGYAATVAFPKSDGQVSARLATQDGSLPAVEKDGSWQVELTRQWTQAMVADAGLPYKRVSYQFIAMDAQGEPSLVEDDAFFVWRSSQFDSLVPKTFAEQALEKTEAQLLQAMDDIAVSTTLNGISIAQERRKELEARRNRLKAEIMAERYRFTALEQGVAAGI